MHEVSIAFSQVKVRCSVPTSCETGKFILQLMLSLNLLFQNTIQFIKWWLDVFWHPKHGHIHGLLIVLQEWGCFKLVYVKPVMKSQNHESKSNMKLTSGDNMYDQSTTN